MQESSLCKVYMILPLNGLDGLHARPELRHLPRGILQEQVEQHHRPTVAIERLRRRDGRQHDIVRERDNRRKPRIRHRLERYTAAMQPLAEMQELFRVAR